MRRSIVPLAVLAAALACGGALPEPSAEAAQDLAPPIELVSTQHWKPGDAYKEMIAKSFPKMLFLLNHYDEEKTGWDD
jgi:ABC-type glycerol-3-phosphate transport system substrate-binding protein